MCGVDGRCEASFIASHFDFPYYMLLVNEKQNIQSKVKRYDFGYWDVNRLDVHWRGG